MPGVRAEISGTDWILLSIVLLLTAILVIRCALRLRTLSDYCLGGQRFGKRMMLLFAFGSGTSTDQPPAMVAGIWRSGLSGLWWQLLWLPVTPFFWLVAPMLRRVRAFTMADFFAVRFGRSTAVLYAVYGIMISTTLIAGILFTSAGLLEVLSGGIAQDAAEQLNWKVPILDVDAALQPHGSERRAIVDYRQFNGRDVVGVLLTVLLVVCAASAGLAGSIVVDAIQGILTAALTLALAFAIVSQLGGVGAISSSGALKAGMFDFVATSGAPGLVDHEPLTPFYLAALATAALIGFLAQPHIMCLVGAGRSETEARFGYATGNLMKRCLAVVCAVIGLGCLAWYLGPNSPLLESGDPDDVILHGELSLAAQTSPNLRDDAERPALNRIDDQFAESVFGRVGLVLLPKVLPGLLGLMMAAVVAAVISHCGTQMIVAGGLFTENIYRTFMSPHASQRRYIWVCRISGVMIVLTAVALQASFSDAIDALKLIIKTPATIGLSIWMGLFWIRWNTAAVWVSTLLSTATWILVAWFPEQVLFSFPSFQELMFFDLQDELIMKDSWQIVWYLGAGLLGGTITALMTSPAPPDQLHHFFCLLRSPIQPNESTRFPCRVPGETIDQEPVLSFGSFQCPRPTRLAVIGFVVFSLLTIGIIYATKWLSSWL
jgi:solute:Na+ symporter, SSS family